MGNEQCCNDRNKQESPLQIYQQELHASTKEVNNNAQKKNERTVVDNLKPQSAIKPEQNSKIKIEVQAMKEAQAKKEQLRQKQPESGLLKKELENKKTQQLEKVPQVHQKSEIPVPIIENSSKVQATKGPQNTDPASSIKHQTNALPWQVKKSLLKQQIEIPENTSNVEEVLNQKKFFVKEELQNPNIKVRKYGDDIYVGSLDAKQKPNGFGKMYKKDKSLYIGYFVQGKAHGKGAFIFPDGAYYSGEFRKNQAEDQHGEYHSKTFHYVGGFKQNAFDGQGEEKNEGYRFKGKFRSGSRSKGTLIWNNQACKYTGAFNASKQFEGSGQLIQPQGTYEGNFKNGEKEGEGVYVFKNGSKYVGTYSKGRREGFGKIYLKENQLQYEGEMRNGLPNGKGKIKKQGRMVDGVFVDGIESSHLPQ